MVRGHLTLPRKLKNMNLETEGRTILNMPTITKLRQHLSRTGVQLKCQVCGNVNPENWTFHDPVNADFLPNSEGRFMAGGFSAIPVECGNCSLVIFFLKDSLQ